MPTEKNKAATILQSHCYRGGSPPEGISIRKARKFTKKGGKTKINNALLTATPYNRIPTPTYSVAEVGQFLHAWGQHLFPARCPSKTHRVGRACSTPNIINPPKPKGWFIKETHPCIHTHTHRLIPPVLALPEAKLPAGSEPNPSL